MENPIPRYLVDAIAAEKSFETQLKGFALEATNTEVKNAFSTHAEETRQQYEQLTDRLNALGGETSSLKSFMAHIFNFAPKAAQIGHDIEERATQNLIMAYSVENAEVAMYESLIMASEAVGDTETVALARKIQAQEQATAEKVWKFIAPMARQAVSSGGSSGKELLVGYLEDAEAAERNFEDALAGFSKMGDQADVQAVLAMMSSKAKTQHERLEAHLRARGGSPSTAKSFLAHMLAFTPLSAQLSHAASEKSTQHLMITYSAAAAEMGMYESLANAAEVLGDEETVRLARQLQSEEKEDYDLAWQHLGRSARAATAEVSAHAS